MSDKFGFGCMRLPMNGSDVNYEEFNKMIDVYMENGFNYFDTAHGYIEGKSETAIRDCLVSRYPRESYTITNKLSGHYFKNEDDIRPLFEKQLKQTGVDYFDYYLMHAQDRENYKHYTKCRAYEIAQELKAEGKIKHVGISFHDTADVLDMILTEHPEIEIVQIQFNYIDYDNSSVQSRKNYEVCVKHNKPVLIMEPLKGGGLVNLPTAAREVLDQLNNGSYASYAMRFAGQFDSVVKVLSGMSTLEQTKDNVTYMKDLKPLSEEENKAIQQVINIINEVGGIACTGCRYCVDGCPMNIAIPDLFGCYNAKKQFNDWNSDYYYGVHTKTNGKASDCIGCGQCVHICPQHLPIIEDLAIVAEVFEK